MFLFKGFNSYSSLLGDKGNSSLHSMFVFIVLILGVESSLSELDCWSDESVLLMLRPLQSSVLDSGTLKIKAGIV